MRPPRYNASRTSSLQAIKEPTSSLNQIIVESFTASELASSDKSNLVGLEVMLLTLESIFAAQDNLSPNGEWIINARFNSEEVVDVSQPDLKLTYSLIVPLRRCVTHLSI